MADHDVAPSFALSALETERLIGFAFHNTVTVLRLHPASCAVETLTSWAVPQTVRSIAIFRHQASRKVLLTAAGDGKCVHVYDVTRFTTTSVLETPTTTEPSASSTKPTTDLYTADAAVPLLFTYGPHHKKLSHVTAIDDDIVFADKFGEVYRLRLGYDAETQQFIPAAGDVAGQDDAGDSDQEEGGVVVVAADASGVVFPKSTSVFLLQHFSLLTQLCITSSVPRRILSCDRESHARVSQYPHTFVIDQYLWNASPQNPITCVTELEDTQCEGTVWVTGDTKGRVTFWGTVGLSSSPSSHHSNNKDKKGDETPFHRLAVLDLYEFHHQSIMHAVHAPLAPTSTASTAADAAGSQAAVVSAEGGSLFGIVGITFLKNASADCQGVLIAVDGVEDLFYCPVRDGGYNVEVCTKDLTRVPLGRAAVGLARAAPNVAWVVPRVNPTSTSHVVAVLESDSIEDSSRVRIVEVAASPLAASLAPMELNKLDVFAYWRPAQAKDPRARAAAAVNGEDETEDASNKNAAKKPRTQ